MQGYGKLGSDLITKLSAGGNWHQYQKALSLPFDMTNQSLFRSLAIGLLVSFAGSVGPSAINLTVLQVSVEAGFQQGCWFALGMALTEWIFIRASLGGIRRVLERRAIRRALERLILFLFVILALLSIRAAFSDEPGAGTFSPDPEGNSFFLGILFRLLNPSMIPYWLGANAGLLARGLLPPVRGHFNFYAVGCSLGTLAALGLYIGGGAQLTDALSEYRQLLHVLIGCFFLFAAGWMIFQGRAKKSDS
jgi:threonine/homoserine/homoserine lactone efflux protein